MGYRSDVAILMYGEPQYCDVVCDLFLASDVPQDLKDLFERCKQVRDCEGVRYVMWQFHDIKWYNDGDHAKAKLFEFVDAIENERASGDPADYTPFAIEYARMGENDDDNERDSTDKHEWLLTIRRALDYPNIFNSEGERPWKLQY